MFGAIKHIHFIGLGGIGISGMAELLLSYEFKVSGSDMNRSEITDRLGGAGITFFEGHAAENIGDCDLVVYSSAVKQDNPEIVAAKERRIPVIRRAEMLGELLKVAEKSVAVGGTHGKTTTSSIIGTMLTAADRDPTLIIGGIVKSLGTNTRRGHGDTIVVEADEFDRSFLSLTPVVAVITNIDLEHRDTYPELEDLMDAFAQFANAVPFYGRVIVCLDDPLVQALLPRISRPVVTYGLSSQADVQAKKAVFHETTTEFEVQVNGDAPVKVELPVPGEHNVLNALAAIATGLELQVPIADVLDGIKQFSGVGRRFEITEQINDVLFVDDYAHHPREVGAVLRAARSGWDRRIVAVFQPHLYTRTRDFYEDFARAFIDSDMLIVTDVYPSREEPIEGITGEIIAAAAINFGHKNVRYVADKQKLAEAVSARIAPGDMVMTLGAGDITAFNGSIREAYKARENG